MHNSTQYIPTKSSYRGMCGKAAHQYRFQMHNNRQQRWVLTLKACHVTKCDDGFISRGQKKEKKKVRKFGSCLTSVFKSKVIQNFCHHCFHFYQPSLSAVPSSLQWLATLQCGVHVFTLNISWYIYLFTHTNTPYLYHLESRWITLLKNVSAFFFNSAPFDCDLQSTYKAKQTSPCNS